MADPELVSVISALIFASPRPVKSEYLEKEFNLGADCLRELLEDIQIRLQRSGLGIEMVEISESWQLRTTKEVSEVIKKFIKPSGKSLGRAASETLAVIAWRQPVGKAEIEAIRGVDAGPTVRTLLDMKLIRSLGRSNDLGQPILYGTTEVFLEKFGLKDLSELPSVRELKELEEDSFKPEFSLRNRQ